MRTGKISLEKIHRGLDGFKVLVEFYANASSYSSVEADMTKTKWIAGDMCAPFGAIIKKLRQQHHVEIDLINFMSSYNNDNDLDIWHTTIAYREFKSDNEVVFAKYVRDKLVSRQGLDKMPVKFLEKFRKNVGEIFCNVAEHSNSELGVFSCGQHFPNKKLMSFAIANLGVGIRQKMKVGGDSLSSVDAIDWSTKGCSTAKPPSGIGLKSLCDFLDKNNGSVRIVSDTGYWKRSRGKTTKRVLPRPFPGTVVNFEINLDNDNFRRGIE